MAEISDHSVYPGIFGIEEEVWLEFYRHGDTVRQCFTTADIDQAMGEYQRKGGMLRPGQGPQIIFEAPYDMPEVRQFNSAGYREYVDGYNPERSTPQASSITETVARGRGVEQFAASFGKLLIASNKDIAKVVHNRRVGWLGNDFVGTQDNLHAPQPDDSEGRAYHGRIERLVSAIAITRPYLTGAGVHHASGRMAFSQKFRALGRSTYNQEPFVVAHTDTGRIEVRQNDINICDAAAMMRLGGAAIGATLAQTRLFNELDDFILTAAPSPYLLHRFNMPAIDPDGNFMADGNQELLWAAEQHMRLAEMFASNELMHLAGEQPPELLDIAELIYESSDTMREVLCGRESPEAVQHVSDWAARHMQYLQHGVVDYDSTAIARNGGPEPLVYRTGVGFGLRDGGMFAGGISQDEVDRLYVEPPQDTNARIRAAVIGGYVTKRVYWDYAELPGIDHDGQPCEVKVRFGGPLNSELPASERQKLSRAIPLNTVGMPSSAAGELPGATGLGVDVVTDAIYQVINATRQDP